MPTRVEWWPRCCVGLRGPQWMQWRRPGGWGCATVEVACSRGGQVVWCVEVAVTWIWAVVARSRRGGERGC